MSEPAEPKRSTLVRCEKHGLHYDPAKLAGCVLCRREAQASGTEEAFSTADATFLPRRSLVSPLLVTVALCFIAGLVFYFFHGAVANLFPKSPAEEVPHLTGQQQRQLDQALRELKIGAPPITSGGGEFGVPVPGTGPAEEPSEQ